MKNLVLKFIEIDENTGCDNGIQDKAIAYIDNKQASKGGASMKQRLSILLIVALLCGVASADTTRSAVVIDIDEEKDILVMLDGAGLIWEWEGVEDFDYFDLVSFKLISVGKDGIFDDEMTQPIYSGIRVDKSWIIERVSEVDPELAIKLLSK